MNPFTSRLTLPFVASVAALAVLVSYAGEVPSVAAQEVSTVTSTPAQVVVQGRDSSVRVEGSLPSECAGTTIAASFYARGGGAAVNQLVAGATTVQTVVQASGSYSAIVPIPAVAPGTLYRAWPGVDGGCLEHPVVSVAAGLRFAVLDESENGKSSGTFVIPKSTLFLGRADEGQEQPVRIVLTAAIDGAVCATVDVTDPDAKDSDGNVRIHVGGAAQPAACSRDGAPISFTIQGGIPLYEKFNLILGVTQPMENVAPDAAPSTGPSVPLPPNTGGGNAFVDSPIGWATRAGVAVGLLGLALWTIRRKLRA